MEQIFDLDTFIELSEDFNHVALNGKSLVLIIVDNSYQNNLVFNIEVIYNNTFKQISVNTNRNINNYFISTVILVNYLIEMLDEIVLFVYNNTNDSSFLDNVNTYLENGNISSISNNIIKENIIIFSKLLNNKIFIYNTDNIIANNCKDLLVFV